MKKYEQCEGGSIEYYNILISNLFNFRFSQTKETF